MEGRFHVSFHNQSFAQDHSDNRSAYLGSCPELKAREAKRCDWHPLVVDSAELAVQGPERWTTMESYLLQLQRWPPRGLKLGVACSRDSVLPRLTVFFFFSVSILLSLFKPCRGTKIPITGQAARGLGYVELTLIACTQTTCARLVFNSIVLQYEYCNTIISLLIIMLPWHNTVYTYIMYIYILFILHWLIDHFGLFIPKDDVYTYIPRLGDKNLEVDSNLHPCEFTYAWKK